MAARRLTCDRPPAQPFFTVGHSNRSVEEFVRLLGDNGADMVADVRSMPRSRANPQFNIDTLEGELAARQIGYRHLPALGGLRGRQPGPSPNSQWRNASFRNYADYALTPAFQAGLAELIALGGRRTCAVMCAEALWWRCHRRIIADYLLARGARVLHILGAGAAQPALSTPGVARTPHGLIYGQVEGGEALAASGWRNP
jgi:uncharacterized protein (DUF488 family)